MMAIKDRYPCHNSEEDIRMVDIISDWIMTRVKFPSTWVD